MDQPRTLVSEHIRQTSTLTPRVREMLIMRIGLLCRSEYEWAAHAPAGRRTGMTDADVERIVNGPDSGGGDALEVALLRAVDELYRDDVVSEKTWSALAAGLDTKQLLDVLITAGGYRMVSMALNSLGVQLEPNAVRFPATLSAVTVRVEDTGAPRSRKSPLARCARRLNLSGRYFSSTSSRASWLGPSTITARDSPNLYGSRRNVTFSRFSFATHASRSRTAKAR